jgi:hypothetical protein
MDPKESGPKVLEALKELSELKDLAIVSKRLEGKYWSEVLGRIDVPAGSKAFWAMIKRDLTEQEPYNLFIRFDMNAEGEDIAAARANVKSWIESEVVPRLEAKIKIKSTRVLQPNEIYLPEI